MLSQHSIPKAISHADHLVLDRVEGEGIRYETQVYIRQELDGPMLQLFISGPPGCGKTVFTSLLARMYAKNNNMKVLYVAFRDESQCPVIIFDGSNAVQVEKFPTNTRLYDFVEQLANEKDAHFDLALYDGVRKNIEASTNVMALLKDQAVFSKSVFVTSLEFEFKDGNSMPDVIKVYETDEFNSWTQAEHIEAFGTLATRLNQRVQQDILAFAQHRPPAEGVSEIENYVNFKYFYAGGSARFMIDYTIESLKGKLDKLIDYGMPKEH